MDPVSTAGLVLGIIPLLISTVEHYESVTLPFSTYRRHIKEGERFAAHLDVQRTIFRNEAQLLLLAANVGRLEDVVNDPEHHLQYESSKKVEELLGSSCVTVTSTLTLINDTLDEVMEETKELQSLLPVAGQKSANVRHHSLFVSYLISIISLIYVHRKIV
jgi:hypothetical protein